MKSKSREGELGAERGVCALGPVENGLTDAHWGVVQGREERPSPLESDSFHQVCFHLFYLTVGQKLPIGCCVPGPQLNRIR